MKTKIAILGTCSSEDWYHFQGARDRLDAEILRFQPSSIISLMAEPVDMAVEGGTELKEKEVERLKVDFNKSFLSTLVAFKPDILICETLSDSRRGVIPVGNSWVTRTYRVEKSPMEERLGFPKHFNAITDPAAYLDLFRASTKMLDSFLKRSLPNCSIALHKARWSEYYVDENDELKSYKPKQQNQYFVANLRLNALDKIFAQEIMCDEIEIDDIPIFADARHVWGPSSDHYIKIYYKLFTERLRKLISKNVTNAAG